MLYNILSNPFKKKTIGYNSYSVISAVYNVENYLDDYFNSLTKQTLDFNNHINLILVDDGSTDNSSEIIKTWQKKYPENIKYIKKQNGGQASARNLGLPLITTPWVTFIDPDDFVHKKYFEKVDQAVKKYNTSDLSMIACNIQYYFEKLKLYLNKHPLKYKFQNGNTHCFIKDLNKNIQLSASTAFFRTDLIQATQLKFDTKIKPNFEDAHFVNSYLIENYLSSVTFLEDAKYYYRRRKIKNSTIDKAWRKKELFDDVLHFGCLDLFEKANKKLGHIPKFIQRTILYHLSWYYKYIVDHPEVVAFLSQEQKSNFQSLLKKNFEYIDIDTIATFDLSGIDYFIKQGWGNFYKKQSLSYQIVYLYKQNNKLQLYYYANDPGLVHIQIDNATIITPKTIVHEHTFLEEKFINKYQFELPVTGTMKSISIQINSQPTYLKTHNNKYLYKIEIDNIQNKKIENIKQLLYNFTRKIILGK